MSLLLLLASSSAPNVTASGSVAFGLSVSGAGTATPPPITGTASVAFGLTVSASGTVTPPPLGARGITRPIRGATDPRQARRRPSPLLVAARASVPPINATGAALFALSTDASGTATPPPITGTGTVAFGLTVTATGTATPPPITGTGTALFALSVAGSGAAVDTTPPVSRGVFRPIRTPADPRRARRTALAQSLAARPSVPPIDGTGATSFGLSIDGSGTATPPAIAGTGAIELGLSVAGDGTVTPPPISGTGSSLFGLTVTGSGTFGDTTPPVGRGVVRPMRTRRDPRRAPTAGPQVYATTQIVVTGTGTASFGLSVSATGDAIPPGVTGTGATAFDLTVSGTADAATGGFVGRGVVRPVRSRPDPRRAPTRGPQVAAQTLHAIPGTASAGFALAVTATGTAFPPPRPVRVVDRSGRRVLVADAGTARVAVVRAAMPALVTTTDASTAHTLLIDASRARVAVADSSFLAEATV